jgi:hypothetical protein
MHAFFTAVLLISCKKSLALLVTGPGRPWGCETPRLPYSLHNQFIDGGEVVSLTLRPPLP